MSKTVLESKIDMSSSEAKILIENIEQAVSNQNKDLMNQIADEVGEYAQNIVGTDKEEEFRQNVLDVVSTLSELSSAAFLQAIIRRPKVNDILGLSDELYQLMKERVKNQKEVLGNEAFSQAISFHS